MRIFWLTLTLCFFAHPSSAQSGPRSNLMPMPSSMRLGTGVLLIDGSFSVELEGYREPRIDRAVQRFLHDLSHVTGIPMRNQAINRTNATLVIRAEHASKPIQDVDEDEGYTLDVSASGAKLTAPNPLGIMHGLQTFLQLVDVTPSGFLASAVHIEDSPRFPWRGLTIDVSRHFISVNALKRNIDGMTAVKMNVLHLHLSDDQGFRIASKQFPKLVEMGSDGQYYTKAEIRDSSRTRAIAVFELFPNSICRDTALPGLWGIPSLRVPRVHTRLSAGGEFLIQQWTPHESKRTRFSTSSSAKWLTFFQTTTFT